jgi:xylose isomerase
LVTADKIISESDYQKIRSNRYASYDAGKGKDFENGQLTLEDLRNIAIAGGEPATVSGKQEFIENLINRYI